MQHKLSDIEYAEYLFGQFYSIGSNSDGGVTRLGYSDVEDEMHEMFKKLGEEKGYVYSSDEVGNSYLMDPASCDEFDEYSLIASHLDSVIDGGRYDGVSGVIAGFLVMNWIHENNLHIPMRIGAMRCEESSNFGRATIGSGLITREIYKQDIGDALNKEGISLRDIFKKRGYSLKPRRIDNIKEYLELHIEQGKVLEEYGEEVGIVTTIAGPRRFNIHIHGQAEHSGATPMGMRSDALCAAAEIILEIEEIGNSEAAYQSVATVGVIANKPNALNVVPGEVTLGVDMRGIDVNSLDRMEARLKAVCKKVCERRKLKYFREKTSEIPPIAMSTDVQLKLVKAAKELHVSHRVMISGAGHDAMSFAQICDTGMIFIPCAKGVSHNKNEFASISSICDGAAVLFEYLREESL